MRRIILLCAVVAVGVAAIKKDAPARTTAKETFAGTCASCHGKDGRGAGPAAAALKVPPPDLTTLTIRNNGSFPYARVSGTIAGDTTRPDIVTREMPCFGLVFRDAPAEDATTARARVAALTEYIRSLQAR